MEVNFQKVKNLAEFKGIDFQTAARQLGLSPQEALELERLGGDPGKNEDGFVSTEKKQAEEKPKAKEESGLKTLGLAAAVVAGFSAVGGAIGGVLGFFGGAGAGAIPGAIGGAKAGAILGGLLVGAASCTKIEQEADLTFVTSASSNAEIIAELQKLGNNITAALMKLQNDIQVGTDRIIEILQGLGFKLDQIYEALLRNGATGEEILKEIQKNNIMVDEKLTALANGNEEIKGLLSRILTAMGEQKDILKNNNSILTEILNKLATMSYKDDEIIKVLENILAKVTEGVEQNKDMGEKTHALLNAILKGMEKFNKEYVMLLKEVIERINQFDDKTQAALQTIIAALNKLDNDNNVMLKEILEAVLSGNKIAVENQDILKAISDKIDSLKPGDNEAEIYLLKEILQKIVELTAQEKAMDRDTQALIKDLINKFNEFDKNIQQTLAVIIEKMDKLGENGKAALEELLKAIKENTTVAKGTYELVKALLDKVDKLGAKADTIIEVIGKIGTGQNVDLSKIEEMLAALLEQEKANQKIFNDINSKLNLISVTLQGFAAQVDASNSKVLEKLQEILDKIPGGCTCTHETLDITVLIEKLDKIIEEIKKDPKNEGILGDLGELENMLG